VGRENNHGPRAAGRNPHNPWQILPETVHPQSVQVDTRRSGAELASAQDETVYSQGSYPAKICV
jgi:hypothetical protein